MSCSTFQEHISLKKRYSCITACLEHPADENADPARTKQDHSQSRNKIVRICNRHCSKNEPVKIDNRVLHFGHRKTNPNGLDACLCNEHFVRQFLFLHLIVLRSNPICFNDEYSSSSVFEKKLEQFKNVSDLHRLAQLLVLRTCKQTVK